MGFIIEIITLNILTFLHFSHLIDHQKDYQLIVFNERLLTFLCLSLGQYVFFWLLCINVNKLKT